MNSNTLPLHTKDLLPEHKRDCSLFIFMTVAVSFFLGWELLVVVPRYHDGLDFAVAFHICAGLFIVFNIFGNVFLLKRVDTTGKQMNLPAVLREGWNYCYICQMNAPPRAHHCTLCKECVLKRDHHCMFTGCCIGYFNHRYYIWTLIYICLGAIYCVFYQWEYCMGYINGSGWWTLLALVAPHFGLLSGTLNLAGFAVVSLHTFVLVAIVMTGFLLSIQLVCLIKGQTPYERREQIFTYNLGFQRNLVEILGKKWHKTWISAWLESPLPGDGITFMTKSNIEDVKDL